MRILFALLLVALCAGCNVPDGAPQNGTINGVPVICRWVENSSFDFTCTMELADPNGPLRPVATLIEGECP